MSHFHQSVNQLLIGLAKIHRFNQDSAELLLNS
jgi:hypothetical protein